MVLYSNAWSNYYLKHTISILLQKYKNWLYKIGSLIIKIAKNVFSVSEFLSKYFISYFMCVLEL